VIVGPVVGVVGTCCCLCVICLAILVLLLLVRRRIIHRLVTKYAEKIASH